MRSLVWIFVGVVLGSILVACSLAPVSMSDIPLYPGATPVGWGQNEVADTIADALHNSTGHEGVAAVVNLYSLPPGTTWQGLKRYYDAELAATDWELAPELSSESVAFRLVGWERGSGARQQALVAGYVPPAGDQNPFLILGLFTE